MTKEVWKTVPFEGMTDYEISNLGEVRKTVKYLNGDSRKSYLRKPAKGTYKRITIRDSDYKSGYRLVLVQELVLKLFGDYQKELKIVHLDGDTTNDSIDNLKQVTRKEITKKLKDENKLHSPKHTILKCDKDTKEVLKEYNYYSDAARDILYARGYKKEDLKQSKVFREYKRILGHVRYSLVHKRIPEAYGYYWKMGEKKI